MLPVVSHVIGGGGKISVLLATAPRSHAKAAAAAARICSSTSQIERANSPSGVTVQWLAFDKYEKKCL